MPKEIERKFLVDRNQLKLPIQGVDIRQGYLPLSKNVKTVVRVRIKNDKAYLTIKGENIGSVRSEFEYEIPVDEGIEMLETLCQSPIIEKTRYEIPQGNHDWEIDVFHGDNDGLIIAEIELSKEDEDFDVPIWIKEEVTNNTKYYNSSLLEKPYKTWNAT
ncbi:MAG TPA: CYTH domain-containing protein [Anaerolineales bacterium]|nr:CYTH domain-containing protein [Anaerolineales bacterium]